MIFRFTRLKESQKYRLVLHLCHFVDSYLFLSMVKFLYSKHELNSKEMIGFVEDYTSDEILCLNDVRNENVRNPATLVSNLTENEILN